MVWQRKCPSSCPQHFTSFLVGEPKAFPFVVRRRLPLVTGILEALAGDEGESEFMVVRGREKRGYKREGWRDGRRMADTEEKGARRLKKHARVEKAVALVSLNKN
jgi:hypothetical protein